MTSTALWAKVSCVCVCLLGLTFSPGVAFADQDKPVRAPRSAEEGDWWFEAMKLGKAQQQVTGEGATVALLDDGVDTSIPELQGTDIELKTGCRGKPITSSSVVGASHGSEQAALVAGNGLGTGPDGRGIRGVAPGANVRFYSIDYDLSDDVIDCSDYQIGKMMVRAVREGADIISLAATLNETITPYVERVVEQGAVLVVAGGQNDDPGPFYPAALPGVVTVNAVDINADPWTKSPEQTHQVISAPGVFLDTGGIYKDGWTSEAWVTGTSPATSITAGSLALVKSKYPSATGNQLIQHLIHYTGGTRKYVWDGLYGFGIVSVDKMLKSSPTQWPDENPLLGQRADQAIADYPMSASRKTKDRPGKGRNATSGERSPTAGPDQGDTPSPTAEPKSQSANQTEDAGVPTWALLAGAAALLVAAAGGALIARRGRRTTAATDNQARGE